MLKVNSKKDLVKVISNTIERGCDAKFKIMDAEKYSYIMDIKIIDKKYYTFIEGFDKCIEYHSIIELFNEIAEAYLQGFFILS